MAKRGSSIRRRRIPQRPTTQRVEAFIAANGLGGAFIVSIAQQLDDGRVLVRIHSPVHYPDWDGRHFKVKPGCLRSAGKKIAIPLEVCRG